MTSYLLFVFRPIIPMSLSARLPGIMGRPFVSRQIVVFGPNDPPATIRYHRKLEMRPYRSPRRLRIFWRCDLAYSSPSRYTPRRHPFSVRCWSSGYHPRAPSDVDRPVIRDLLSPTWSLRSDIRPPGTSNGESRQRRRSLSESDVCTVILDRKFHVYVFSFHFLARWISSWQETTIASINNQITVYKTSLSRFNNKKLLTKI